MNAKRELGVCIPTGPEAARLQRRNFLRLIGGSAVFDVVSPAEGAEAYPSRPITLVVPFAVGGGTDVIARILAERIRPTLGQPVIIENVTGAAGNIGVGKVARSSPDGYTLSMGIWNTHVANGALYELQFDVVRDFEPIALISATPLVIVARKGVPADDLRALVAWLRGSKDKVTVATAGVGSAEHVAAVLLQDMLGAQFVFVPYRGSSPAIQDLVGGQVDMMLSPSTPATAQIRAGTIKGYAVTSKSRLPAAPDIPSVDEAGLPGFYFSLWTSLWAPKGTPKEIIAKLSATVMEALADPEIRARFTATGPLIVSREQQTPEALAALQKAEIEKWWPIIKAANVKGE